MQIKGGDLEAVLNGVDRAASTLDAVAQELEAQEAQRRVQEEATTRSHGGGRLRGWDVEDSISEAEAYTVLDGQLYVVGSFYEGRRWMMLMVDAEERFAQVQNARLYITAVEAECRAVMAQPDGAGCDSLQLRGSRGGGLAMPDVELLGVGPKPGKGVQGKLLFCALEV